MKNVYTLCGMCGSRCPIEATVDAGEVIRIQGNPYAPHKTAICARGIAAISLERDPERPLAPLIRVGERGEGRWREVSWDEALDYTASGLQKWLRSSPESIMLSHRSGLFTDLYEAFARGMGTPNSFNHDITCTRNAQQACRSVLGLGRGQLVNDYREARHIVFQSRNVFEALNIPEVRALCEARDKGCSITIMDVRATVSAARANTFFLMRPGTDYAMNLAVLHVLITENLYNTDVAQNLMADFSDLVQFIQPYTPQWAEKETGIAAHRIIRLAHELAEAAPRIIWYPGWFSARYTSSFLVSRSAYLINALLGAIGERGGMPIGVTPKDVGRKGLTPLTALYPKAMAQAVDHCWQAGGLLHRAFDAIETHTPYPIKAYVSIRHNVLSSLPDPVALRRKLSQLDLLVAITTTWSATSAFADIILPLSPPLSRESILATKGGLKPQFLRRVRAVKPRFNTRADWEILCGLAGRLGLDKLAFSSIEALWSYQLQGTGVSLDDFAHTGFVSLSEKPMWKKPGEINLSTPSGKFEVRSQAWAKAEKNTLAPYVAPVRPSSAKGSFRLIPGRIATHTQSNTANNSLLFDLMPTNVLWMHSSRAIELGIQEGDIVEVQSANGHCGVLPAHVTEGIHPEAVFVVHGFGHDFPQESRAQGKGIADEQFMPNGLEIEDPLGGGLALQEHFVTVRKAALPV